jgi:hypothetical protein
MDRLGAHCRKDVVASRQTNEEREGHEPHAKPKVRRDLCEAWHVGLVVVRGTLVGARLCIRKVSEPNVMVDQDENCCELAKLKAWPVG